VVVATNARLSKERAHLLALAAHDGIAGAIRPAHTMWDGDAVFALATGAVDADQRQLEAMAEAATAEAIRRAVLLATSVPGFPSVTEGRRA
jgi:L-aminopeptidase/D-esterase-like protein